MTARKPEAPDPADDPAEYQRFLAIAREVEADDSLEAFDRALEKVVKPKKPTKPVRGAASGG
jgi:hypothetical protein